MGEENGKLPKEGGISTIPGIQGFSKSIDKKSRDFSSNSATIIFSMPVSALILCTDCIYANYKGVDEHVDSVVNPGVLLS